MSIWEYLHNKRVFCYKVLSFFINHQDLSFGGFELKIEFVVFVYELINYLILYTWLCNKPADYITSDIGTLPERQI